MKKENDNEIRIENLPKGKAYKQIKYENAFSVKPTKKVINKK